MSSRPALERRPHYVYLHRTDDGAVVYVGRTANPDRRPREIDGRDWMRTTQTGVEIIGPMAYEDACREEDRLIELHSPRHNTAPGWVNAKRVSDFEDRVRREVGVTRKAAVALATKVDPDDPDSIAYLKHAVWGELADDLDLTTRSGRATLAERTA